jgi:predicted enzyme related to lactoylglutathione lyase
MVGMAREPQRYAGGDLVLVLDCSDLHRSAAFWCQVLGYVRMGEPVGAYLGLVPADGRGLQVLLQETDDPKPTKNRLHLDLRTADLPAEVVRVIAAGATPVSDTVFEEHGWTWQVLGDPDGNEFCVVQPPARDPALT